MSYLIPGDIIRPMVVAFIVGCGGLWLSNR